MEKIVFTKTIGKLYLKFLKYGNEIEEHNLGSGRFSITKMNDFYLLNFWVMSEYTVILENGQVVNFSGPTLEILNKIEKFPNDNEELIVVEPNHKISFDDWEKFYRTGYYNGTHQRFLNYKLKITKQKDGFNIHFEGNPSDEIDYIAVTGDCNLILQNELERFW